MTRSSLKTSIGTKLRRSRRMVFLRADFEKLGGYDQVGRALRELISEGKLVKIGYGLYAKARLNRFTGNPMLAAEGGFDQVAREALDRLGVDWQPSAAWKKYQEGTSTQIPANARVKVRGRFSRKIANGNTVLQVVTAA